MRTPWCPARSRLHGMSKGLRPSSRSGGHSGDLPGPLQGLPAFSISLIAYSISSRIDQRVLANSSCLRSAIARRASSSRDRTASSADPSPWSGNTTLQSGSSADWETSARSRRPRNIWTAWRTLPSLTSWRSARQICGFANRIDRSNRAPARKRLVARAAAAISTRFGKPGTIADIVPLSPISCPARRIVPVTATAIRLPRKISRIQDRRIYSANILSSASLLALTPCIINNVTARVSAVIAACAPSIAPKMVSVELASGNAPTGSILRSSMSTGSGAPTASARSNAVRTSSRLGRSRLRNCVTVLRLDIVQFGRLNRNISESKLVMVGPWAEFCR